MKIATFNANSLRARAEIIGDWLAEHAPDVLGVQETKVQDAQFPLKDFAETGYYCVFRGQKSYNGVAIFTRSAPDRVVYGLGGDDPAILPRVLAVTIGGVTVLNTYVPQGYSIDSEKYAFKLDFFKRVRAFLEAHHQPGERLVWIGDLNVAPLSIDVYEPETKTDHVCYHEAVRAALAEVMAWGLEDVFRKHVSEPGQYTFWDYRIPNAVPRGMGWRIDHILATAPMAALSTGAWIDTAPRLAARPSDHTFLVAEFDL
ncbi:exodeoxyribonuclease III [bacterium]|nr:exodeoxyribonuclease III [candidate division CSSED10-310 bacterium]